MKIPFLPLIKEKLRAFWREFKEELGYFSQSQQAHKSDKESSSISLTTYKPTRYQESQYLFERWKTAAFPIVRKIIEKNPEKLIGLSYLAHDPYRRFSKEPEAILSKITDVQKGSFFIESLTTHSEDLPGLIMEHNGTWLAEDLFYSMAYIQGGMPINPRRNLIVKEIEYLTGINLKKEVQKKRAQKQKTHALEEKVAA